LRFAFAFHQKRVNEAKNRQIISTIIEQLSGKKLHITCLYDPSLKGQKVAAIAAAPTHPDAKTSAAATSGSLATISNIFGGGELLQS
ncbi:MAG TPA: hypothetical protein VFH39_04095, partial [Candidatus Saccharimonadales bacterium]|nr:hypothetical protein [Candidatus Saccharimonadales bacterium]